MKNAGALHIENASALYFCQQNLKYKSLIKINVEFNSAVDYACKFWFMPEVKSWMVFRACAIRKPWRLPCKLCKYNLKHINISEWNNSSMQLCYNLTCLSQKNLTRCQLMTLRKINRYRHS